MQGRVWRRLRRHAFVGRSRCRRVRRVPAGLVTTGAPVGWELWGPPLSSLWCFSLLRRRRGDSDGQLRLSMSVCSCFFPTTVIVKE